MYHHIRGELKGKSRNGAIVEAGGVGYFISMPQTSMDKLPASGQVVVYTTLVVRDDAMKLFGFSSMEERSVFQTLTDISNVGPSTALNVLSGIKIQDLLAAAIRRDPAPLEKIKGVGKKTAERIVLELKDKINALSAAAGPITETNAPPLEADALLALVGMGFQRPAAEKAVVEALKAEGEKASLENIIKASLKLLR